MNARVWDAALRARDSGWRGTGRQADGCLLPLRQACLLYTQAYLKLPCVLDTPSKRRRKEEMEAQMGEIERDMRALEHARVVHITAD